MRKSVYIGMVLFVIIAGITAGIIVHVYKTNPYKRVKNNSKYNDNS